MDTVTMSCMAPLRKKPKVPDRRAPTFMTRVPEELREALEAKAKADFTDVTKTIISYIVRGLREDRYLPPADPPLAGQSGDG